MTAFRRSPPADLPADDQAGGNHRHRVEARNEPDEDAAGRDGAHQDFLEREGVRSLRDVAGTVPNLQLGTGTDSGTATTIRGVTSTDFTEVGEGAVAIHVDGFYSPRSQGTLALMYDLERVEVLRGPQGTLFGMNASGGVINIIPASPEFGDTFSKLDVAVGNYDSSSCTAC